MNEREIENFIKSSTKITVQSTSTKEDAIDFSVNKVKTHNPDDSLRDCYGGTDAES